MEGTRRTKGVHRGPRSGRVLESVRRSTMSELARVGFAALTVEDVARVAGVNRTTIYRRWPTKAALLTAVAEPLLERYDHDPDTGSLGGDLLSLTQTLRENLALPEGRALTLAAGASSEELRELSLHAMDRARSSFRRAFGRARARGEVGPDDDVETIEFLVFSGVVAPVLLSQGIPTEDQCRRMLRVALAPLGRVTLPDDVPSGLQRAT